MFSLHTFLALFIQGYIPSSLWFIRLREFRKPLVSSSTTKDTSLDTALPHWMSKCSLRYRSTIIVHISQTWKSGIKFMIKK